MGFPAITLRDQIERPEALDAGGMITAGVEYASILRAVRFVLSGSARATEPDEYAIDDTSRRVVAYLLSTAHSHHVRNGIRLP